MLLLAIFHLLLQLSVVAPREFARTDIDRDVPVYWQAAKNVRANVPIYTKQVSYGPDHFPQSIYIYPPPFAAVIAPLGSLSFKAFSKVWFCLILLAFWIFAYSLAKLFKGERKVTLRDVLVWGLVAGLFPGTYTAIGLGQVDPILWALFAIGLIGIARPALWALAALVKAFYVWPWIADLITTFQRDGVRVALRALAGAMLVIGILVFYGGIICGWHSYVVWGRDVLPTLSQGNFKYDNVSLSFAVLRLARLVGWDYLGGPLPLLAHLWLTAASIGAPLLAWWLSRHRMLQIKHACIIAASVLFAPVCWTCYLPLLLPLVALVIQDKQV